jgi:hypothetical protein
LKQDGIKESFYEYDWNQTPDEVKDYSLDWSKDIGSDTIPNNASSTWFVSPSSASVTATSINNGTLATVWISGGVVGQVYQVKNCIVTAAGRELTKVFRLLVVANNYL